VILKGIGPQTKNDLSFLTSDFAVRYVDELHWSAMMSLNCNEVDDKSGVRSGDMAFGEYEEPFLLKTVKMFRESLSEKSREIVTVL